MRILSLVLFLILTTIPAFATGQLEARYNFCGNGDQRRRIQIDILAISNNEWDVLLSVNGRNELAKRAEFVYADSLPSAGFLFAVLPAAKTPPIFLFADGHAEWAGRYYFKCT
jgi:hypothetical protein